MIQRTLSIFLFFLGFSISSFGQIDTSKNQELRLSFLGTTLSEPLIDDRFTSYGQYTNLSITYLRRYLESDYFLKAGINGKTIEQEQIFANENVGTTLWTNINVFLGFEKQYQYKHFGAFFGAGIMGGFLDYQADYQFPDEVPVSDLNILQRYIGLSGELTLFTNITDQLYLYTSISLSTFYSNKESNITSVFKSIRGLDTALLLNGIGMAYKF